MDNLKFEKQENLRKKGMVSYILIHGVLAWGVLTATLVTIIKWYFGDPQTVESIIRSFVIFPTVGVLWGWVMWMLMKKMKANV